MKRITQRTLGDDTRMRLTTKYLKIDHSIGYGSPFRAVYRATRENIAKALKAISRSRNRTGALTPYEVQYIGPRPVKTQWIDRSVHFNHVYMADVIIYTHPSRLRPCKMAIGCQKFSMKNYRTIKKWAGVR